MEVKICICPVCGAKLKVENNINFCYQCGNKIRISYERNTPPKESKLRKFTMVNTGIPLASAIVPTDYILKGIMKEQWQSDSVPFTITVQAVSPDHSIFLVSSSSESFDDYKNPLLKAAAGQVPDVIRSGFRDFIEPERYLQEYAQHLVGVSVMPVAKTTLPSIFGCNLQKERAKFEAEVNANLNADPGQPARLSNIICDAILMKFSAQINGRQMVILAGADYQGIEYYFVNMQTAMGGMQNVFSGLFSNNTTEQPRNIFEYGMKGGLIGQMLRGRGASRQEPPRQQERPTRRSDGTIPFGHAKEYGKRVDVITWGGRQLYGMVAPVEKEKEATEVFLKFVGSMEIDPAQVQRAKWMTMQRNQQKLVQSQQYQMRAHQLQMQNMQRQQILSQTIAQNNADISAGIMDSYAQRSDSQSRMSAGFSEAIRGVNTYETPYGSTVEASVRADHVYQNQYGDTFGVSGNAVDSELAAKLNWTELNKK